MIQPNYIVVNPWITNHKSFHTKDILIGDRHIVNNILVRFVRREKYEIDIWGVIPRGTEAIIIKIYRNLDNPIFEYRFDYEEDNELFQNDKIQTVSYNEESKSLKITIKGANFIKRPRKKRKARPKYDLEFQHIDDDFMIWNMIKNETRFEEQIWNFDK